MKSKKVPAGEASSTSATRNPTSPTTLTLRGQHGQCAACREYFNSTHAFDTHRVGRYTPMERRCLTPAQMRAKGMAVNSAGFWVSKLRSENADSSQTVVRQRRDVEGVATLA